MDQLKVEGLTGVKAIVCETRRVSVNYDNKTFHHKHNTLLISIPFKQVTEFVAVYIHIHDIQLCSNFRYCEGAYSTDVVFLKPPIHVLPEDFLKATIT